MKNNIKNSIKMRISKDGGNMPSFDELSRFLTNISSSYKNFLKINLKKKGYPDVSDTFLEEYSTIQIKEVEQETCLQLANH